MMFKICKFPLPLQSPPRDLSSHPEGRASWLCAFFPCHCLLWSVGAALWREQQLHAWAICFPVNMASLQGYFPVSLLGHIQENETGWTHTASVKASPQESGALPWGSCFQGIDVSWKQAGGSSVSFLLPQLCHSLLPLPHPRLSLRHADLWKWANIAVYHRQLLLQGEEGKDSALRKGDGYASAWKDENCLIPGMILVFHQCFCYISFFWPLCSPLSMVLL